MKQPQTKDDWETLISAAENGNSEAQYNLAVYYGEELAAEDGAILAREGDALSALWMKRAYENGHLDAQKEYANYLCEGKGCERNLIKAFELYNDAIAKGDCRAALCLGIEYMLLQDYVRAFEFYARANSMAVIADKIRMGLCSYYGIGTPQNKAVALEYFKAVNEGEDTGYDVDEANYLIGKMYLDGEVVHHSLDEARKYLELADRDGDHRSAQELLLIIGRTKDINSRAL